MAQGGDALNRLFFELKSKNEDIRIKASQDLYGAVVATARGRNASPRELSF